MAEVEMEMESEKNMKERKVSWGKLRRVDSLNLEAGRLSMSQTHHSSWKSTFILAFQSIGVVYGDIGTSPLYVYASSFPNNIAANDDLLGILSLIFYTIVLIPLLKYVFIVLHANDNGDGGTFALYSLLSRYAKVSLIPNEQPEDRQLSNYNLQVPSTQLRRAEKIKHKLESSKTIQLILFFVTILGTSMVIGDGVLTPCISVLSAVGGIKSLGQDAVVGISIAILVILFSVQRYGTDRVGTSFAPIILLWYLLIGGIGLYNLFKYDITILRSLNPKYIYDYFRRNGKDAWISLGGVVLSVTGTEAMFADLGHFTVRAIQISFSGLVFPGLLFAYAGQAAYLSKFPDDVSDTFYKSVPDPLYWPAFVMAVAASVIASQAMISASFSIVAQSLSLGCFPRVKVVHTSTKYEGQVYIPEVNYLLMICCVLVCWAFKTTEKIGHAYGIAVVAVMVITTVMVTLIMLVIWKVRVIWVVLFSVGFLLIECVYLSSVLYKIKDGGYLPLAFSLILMTVMGIWHYVHKERYMYELRNKVSAEYITDLAANPAIKRLPGMGLLYSELVQGIPPIFPHFLSNIPSTHSVLVVVSIKSLPISKVALEERFLFRQVGPREYRMFRCVVRYGYNNAIEEAHVFERQLVEGLKNFIRHEHFAREGGDTEALAEEVQHSTLLVRDGNARVSAELVNGPGASSRSVRSSNGIRSVNSGNGYQSGAAEEEMQFVQKAMDKGVVYLLGEAEVVAEAKSSLLKKFVVNYAYDFLRKNFRQGDTIFAIPRTRLLKVGMTYEI
ncbi:potassium transporter 5 [Mercurialis annua]|uniref:potassium transporter 5 n=1 Tax=Mercurialis annua TaxID=3986 RepID=UPI00215E8C7A|nr:potassium transporter 5 [Mercurialis annua]